MEDMNCSKLKSQTRPMVVPNIHSLPDDILFDILVHVPAQDIYNCTRLVCRKWYNLIMSPKFMHPHLRCLTRGLLARNQHHQKSDPTFVAMRKDRVKTQLSYDYESRKSSNIIMSSCNGLILECDFINIHALYVTNLVTKQRFALPLFVGKTVFDNCAIAYVATTMEYKVVCTFYDRDSNSRGSAILTVGVDKSWRNVCSEHLSLEEKRLLGFSPFTTEGRVHWVLKGPSVLTLDVETEIFTLIRVPAARRGERYYFSSGSYLSLLITCSPFSWEVWELEPKTREWNSLLDIDLEAKKWIIERLGLKHGCFFTRVGALKFRPIPVGWLKFQEVLVFNVCKVSLRNEPIPTGFYIAYNIHTQKIDSFELDCDSVSFVVHTNSLVWLDGC